MPRYLTALLCFSLLLVLTGCQSKDSAATESFKKTLDKFGINTVTIYNKISAQRVFPKDYVKLDLLRYDVVKSSSVVAPYTGVATFSVPVHAGLGELTLNFVYRNTHWEIESGSRITDADSDKPITETLDYDQLELYRVALEDDPLAKLKIFEQESDKREKIRQERFRKEDEAEARKKDE